MSDKAIAQVRRRFLLVQRSLGERAKRHWVGAEAESLGRGGVAWVAKATNMAISTVRKGRDELRRLEASAEFELEAGRERRRGGGRRPLKEKDPLLVANLLSLVSPSSRGDPESPLQWTTLSLRQLSHAMKLKKHPAGKSTIQSLLHDSGFSLQANAKVTEGTAHPDRDAQFQRISDTAADFLNRGLPVISVDAKKKEFLGQRASPGREWTPKGEPIKVMSHDFVSDKDPVAIPYGIYDVGKNLGFVNVGSDHNTPTFAARSIAKWWRKMGKPRYPDAKELFVTADAGGSNSPRSNVFKVELQKLADKTGLKIHVSHFPPGTSKWNKIEHRLFSHITMNWRGRPLTSYEVIVSLIGTTKTSKGLRVVAQLDASKYPRGVSVSKQHLTYLSLRRAAFHGEWNYSVEPRTKEQRQRAKQARPSAPGRSRKLRRQRWLELFRRQLQSGLSQKEFCKKEHINRSSFSQARIRIAGAATHEQRRHAWKEIIAQQRASGLSAKEFCRKRRIRYGNFSMARIRMIRRAKRLND